MLPTNETSLKSPRAAPPRSQVRRPRDPRHRPEALRSGSAAGPGKEGALGPPPCPLPRPRGRSPRAAGPNSHLRLTRGSERVHSSQVKIPRVYTLRGRRQLHRTPNCRVRTTVFGVIGEVLLPLLIRSSSQLVLALRAQDRYQPFHHEAFLLGEDTFPLQRSAPGFRARAQLCQKF